MRSTDAIRRRGRRNGAALDVHRKGSDAENVSIVKRRWRLDPLPVQERSVPTLKIFDDRAVTVDQDPRVSSGNLRVVDVHRHVWIAADHVFARQQSKRQARDAQTPERAGRDIAARRVQDLAAERVAESMNRADESGLP